MSLISDWVSRCFLLEPFGLPLCPGFQGLGRRFSRGGFGLATRYLVPHHVRTVEIAGVAVELTGFTAYTPGMKTKTRLTFSPETIDILARRLADYRLGGCPSGEGAAITAAAKQTAAKHRRNYSELWALVHAAAYAIIDADSRSSLLATSTSPKS